MALLQTDLLMLESWVSDLDSVSDEDFFNSLRMHCNRLAGSEQFNPYMQQMETAVKNLLLEAAAEDSAAYQEAKKLYGQLEMLRDLAVVAEVGKAGLSTEEKIKQWLVKDYPEEWQMVRLHMLEEWPHTEEIRRGFYLPANGYKAATTMKELVDEFKKSLGIKEEPLPAPFESVEKEVNNLVNKENFRILKWREKVLALPEVQWWGLKDTVDENKAIRRMIWPKNGGLKPLRGSLSNDFQTVIGQIKYMNVQDPKRRKRESFAMVSDLVAKVKTLFSSTLGLILVAMSGIYTVGSLLVKIVQAIF